MPPIRRAYPVFQLHCDEVAGIIALSHTDEKMDLPTVIQVVDNQRLIAQDAYWAFNDYLDMLMGMGIKPC